MADGQLIRRLLPFERNFTTMPNDWTRDSKLSPKALGILVILMSHEHGWKIGLGTLAKDRKVGIDYIRSGVDELVTHGYLIRRPSRIGIGDDWEICDPTSLSDPALIGYQGLREPVDNRVIHNPLENPTGRKIQRVTRGKIQRLKENQLRNRDLPRPATVVRGLPVDNSDAFGDDPRPAGASPETCVNGHRIIGRSGGGVPFCDIGCPPRASLRLVEARP